MEVVEHGPAPKRTPTSLLIRVNIAVKSQREVDQDHRILDSSSDNAQLQSHAVIDRNHFNWKFQVDDQFREAMRRIQRYPSTEVKLSLKPDTLTGCSTIVAVAHQGWAKRTETMLYLQLPVEETIRPCLFTGSRWSVSTKVHARLLPFGARGAQGPSRSGICIKMAPREKALGYRYRSHGRFLDQVDIGLSLASYRIRIGV